LRIKEKEQHATQHGLSSALRNAAMDRLAQLESLSDQLSAAVKSLVCHCRRMYTSNGANGHATEKSSTSPEGLPRADAEVDKELERAKASVLASVTQIRRLVYGPSDFLQQLASQVRLPCRL
jgi:hypothetical protein